MLGAQDKPGQVPGFLFPTFLTKMDLKKQRFPTYQAMVSKILTGAGEKHGVSFENFPLWQNQT